MADWIATVDEIDHHLQSIGVPDDSRMRAVCSIATALAQAYKARERAERELEAARLLPYGAAKVAERQECHRATAYRRAKRAKVVALVR